MTLFWFALVAAAFAEKEGSGDVEETRSEQLEKLLPAAVGQERLEMLVQLAQNFSVTEPQRSLDFGLEALTLADEVTMGPDLEARLARSLSRAYAEQSEMDEAFRWSRRALELAEASGDERERMLALRAHGEVHSVDREFAESLAFHRQVLEIARRLGEPLDLVQSLRDLGRELLDSGDYAKALTHLVEASEIPLEEHQLDLRGSLLNDIAGVHYFLGDHEKALVYYEKVRELWEEPTDLVVLEQNIGACLSYLGRHGPALEAHQRTLALARQLGDVETESQVMSNVVHNLLELGRADEALTTARRALTLLTESGEPAYEAIGWHTLALALAEVGSHDEALQAIARAEVLAKEDTLPGFEAALQESYSSIYETSGNFEKALERFKIAKELESAELSAASRRRIEELETRYESARKDQEIASLRLEGQVVAAELDRQRTLRNAALAGAGLLLLTALSIALSLRAQRRAHRELEEQTAQVKVLRGMLPMCATCKKIRDDEGYWNQLEVYLAAHSEAELSHGMCPECLTAYCLKEGLPFPDPSA